MIAQLRQQLYELQKDLLGFKQLVIKNNIPLPEDMSELTLGLNEPTGSLDRKSILKSSAKFGYYGDKETEDENKRLKEQLLLKDRTISQLETQVVTLKDQFQEIELEKCEISREKDILLLQLESLTKLCEKNEIDINNEIKAIIAEKQNSPDGEDWHDLEFADFNKISAVEEYRFKNEKLSKELHEKEAKLKLLQNE